jgi:hypothetical protein
MLQLVVAMVLACKVEDVDLDKVMVPELAVKVMLELYEDYKSGTHAYGQENACGKRTPMVRCSKHKPRGVRGGGWVKTAKVPAPLGPSPCRCTNRTALLSLLNAG